MEITLAVPDYNPSTGMKFNWIDNFKITVQYADNSVFLIANKEGLISLANHLLNLAQNNIPINYHFHLDEINSLEEGSVELVIQKSD